MTIGSSALEVTIVLVPDSAVEGVKIVLIQDSQSAVEMTVVLIAGAAHEKVTSYADCGDSVEVLPIVLIVELNDQAKTFRSFP